MPQKDTALPPLTNRETEIVKLLISGFSTKQIALLLNLSIHTVASHKTSMRKKLQLPNTAALIRWALLQQLDSTA